MKKLLLALSIVLAGCSAATAPVNSVAPATDYFWNSTSDVTLRDTANGISHHLALQSLSGGFTAIDAVSTGGSTTLAFRVNGDTVYGENFTTATFLQLDPATHLSALDTIQSAIGYYQPTELLQTDGPSSLLISTDSGGVFQFNPVDSSWSSIGLSALRQETQLVQDLSDKSICCCTATGQIWHTTDRKNWTLLQQSGLPSDITKLVAINSVLYAAVATGGVYALAAGTSSWQQLPTLTTTVVTALGYNSATSTLLIGGSAANGIDGVIGSWSAGKVTSTATLQGTGAVICFCGPISGKMFAGTAVQGVYENSTSSSIWVAAAWSPRLRVTSMATAAGGSIYLVSDNAAYYSSITSTTIAKQIPSIPAGIPIRIANSGGIELLTSNGVYFYSTTTSNWTLYKHGLQFKRADDVPGGLKFFAGPSAVGSAWRAGTLAIEAPTLHSLPLTARVIDHLDRLVLTQLHSDILVVRYAHEISGILTDPALSFWIIFYERGHGPVLIQKIQGGTTSSSEIE